LAGNLLLAVFLRITLVMVYWTYRKYSTVKGTQQYIDTLAAFKFVLNNPRLVTTHIFLFDETVYLVQFFVGSSLFMFIFFLITSIRDPSLQKYGSHLDIARLGLFQILNTRHAGFAVFNFRDLPQSVLLLYALSMFLSPSPFISLLHASGTQMPR
jgi:Trk-type K+ transport system membrane component